MTDWLGKPYYSLDAYLKKTFGEKVYKLSLDGGMTCPNRDGTCGDRGCIFCSAGGSGDFAGERTSSPKQSGLVPIERTTTSSSEIASRKIFSRYSTGAYVFVYAWK